MAVTIMLRRQDFRPLASIAVILLLTVSFCNAFAPLDHPNFEIQHKQRCIGGPVIGEVLFRVEECQQKCLETYECAGINYHNPSGSCVPRTVGCSLVDDLEIDFLRKRTFSEATPVNNNKVNQQFQEIEQVDAFIFEDSSPQPRGPPEVKRRVQDIDMIFNEEPAVFAIDQGFRCVGFETITSHYGELDHCLNFCAAAHDCAGVNFIPSFYFCEAKTFGCKMTPSSAYEFHAKLNMTEAEWDAWEVATSQPRSEPAVSYEKLEHSRCIGGNKVGDIMDNLADCQEICRLDRNCYGVNYSSWSGKCVARTNGCRMIAEQDNEFYQKKTF